MKEYYTIAEVAKMVGRNRATIYSRIDALNIKTHKFNLDRKSYIAATDVEKIKDILVRPWIAGEKTEKATEEPSVA